MPKPKRSRAGLFGSRNLSSRLFMVYAMRHTTHEDMRALRRYVSDEHFREALDRAPPGIIDPRSWAYQNSVMDRYPAPPLSKRRFG